MVGHAGGPALGDQFEHVEWEGFRFYDLIFPLFLFLVGVVLPFSLRKYQTGEHPKSAALGRTARRVVLLFLLGLIYNNLLKFDFANLRMTGVLQRIAICYGIAALIFLFTKMRTQAILFVAILAGYWAILMYVPSPDSKCRRSLDEDQPGRLSRPPLSSRQDLQVLLRLRRQRGAALDDPGGCHRACWACWPATGCSRDRNRWTKAFGLAFAGLACLGLGLLWSQEFPIIKILWTSSYVLVAGGWSLLLLALFYTIIDVIKSPHLGVHLRGDRRQRDHDLHRQGNHPVRRDRGSTSSAASPVSRDRSRRLSCRSAPS